MALIEFNHVTKFYRHNFWDRRIAAVHNLSFAIAANTITGFVGPNGAGKTTSLKMLMGLTFPSSGTIEINGISAHLPQARAGVAFVTEQPYFYPYLSVKESLTMIAGLQKIPGSKKRIEQALGTVDLEHAADQKVKTLSKGMQQRLNLAAALLTDASCFVFDEPMSGLDPLGRSLFRSIFHNLKNSGKTIFFSTHILDDIESLCERVVVLSAGALRYEGAVAELLAQGFLGTEITVSELPEGLSSALIELGCHIKSTENNHWEIFVKSTGHIGECQKLLFQNNVIIDSIKPRLKSLETLLYAK